MGTNQRHRRRNFHQVIGVILVITGLFFGIQWWLHYVSRGPTISVSFVDASGKPGPSFSLEVAQTAGEHARGLMFRKSMAEHEGMIFLSPEERVQTFWMKETYIPLDMIFLDNSHKVVGILHDVPILNETPRKIDKPSRYVIELNGGTAKRFNIVEGSVAKGIE